MRKILPLLLFLFAAQVQAQSPGPIVDLSIEQTGLGIMTSTWEPHPEGITYAVRWGPVGLDWGLKYNPGGDFQNEHRTPHSAFVLSGLDVGQTGEIQVVAFDSTQTGSDRYGPISSPVTFEVVEWANPVADTVAYPLTTQATFPERQSEFYLVLPDGRTMKMARLWKWLDFGWHGVWGIWIGTER